MLTILLLMCIPATGQNKPPGIQVEMDAQRPLLLHLKVTSGAATQATFFKYHLPWGSVHSIILVAVAANGENLERDMPIDDPSVERISLGPNESVSGVIDLRGVFRGLDKALVKSDVHLFWAYHAPDELGIVPWSGGWILLGRQ